jgi:hypothetical protein
MKLLVPSAALLFACAAACEPTRLPSAHFPQRAAAPAASARDATSRSTGCDVPEVERTLAQQLFDEQEFHDYICEGQPCTLEEFDQRLTIEQVVLRDEPRTLGCIVGPLHPALTRIYGVFLLDQPTPSLALVFVGIDISVDPAFQKPGFKDLVGSERLSPDTWVTHRYVWRQPGYELESTTPAVDAPDGTEPPKP